MAVLVRTNHRAVQMRRERAVRHGERERQVAVAVVATRVEEITRVFEPVLHVDAFGVRRQIHAPRHLRAERRLGARLPRFVVVARVEEAVGRSVEQLAPEFLVVDRVDHAVRHDHAVPAVFGEAVRNGRDARCPSAQTQLRYSLGEFIGGGRGGALDPVAMLHPRLEHAPSLVAARAVGMLVVQDEVPPRAIHGGAVDRAGKRAEPFRGLEHSVRVQLVGEQFGRRGGVLQPAARHLARQRGDLVAEMLLEVLERLVETPDRTELRPRPLFVPGRREVGELGVGRLVVAVGRREPNVVGVLAFQDLQERRHPRLYGRDRRAMLVSRLKAKPRITIAVLRGAPHQQGLVTARRLPTEHHRQRRVV